MAVGRCRVASGFRQDFTLKLARDAPIWRTLVHVARQDPIPTKVIPQLSAGVLRGDIAHMPRITLPSVRLGRLPRLFRGAPASPWVGQFRAWWRVFRALRPAVLLQIALVALLILSMGRVPAAPLSDESALKDDDPHGSLLWSSIRRDYLGDGARARFDRRVQVQGPVFAEDAMNVPISVKVDPTVGSVEEIVVIVDRNPIKKVLSYQPRTALPSIAFRFKLEQASPVRAAVRLSSGEWLVGSTWVESAGGGCTVSGATRKDGSWSQTLGEVSARLFSPDPGASRLRLKIMHPMDTGLVSGVPAFYINQLSVRDGQDHELARLQAFEPVSENPVFSFDFRVPPAGGVHIVGTDNNGNRIGARMP